MQNPKPRQKAPQAKACGNCAHRWRADPDKPDLFCRRYPPERAVDGRCNFPAVMFDWLCGEYAP